MCEIPKGFPSTTKLKELKRIVCVLSEELRKIGLEKSSALPDINRRAQLAALIQLGESEVQGRQNKYISLFSGAVAITSLVVAYSALSVSENTSKSSVRWENKQIEILQSINQNISDMSNNENGIIKEELNVIKSEIKKSESKIIHELNKIKTANNKLKRDAKKRRAP
ncbi:MAG: hypothetical protein KAT25_02310 [Sulfuriflexus sp.]|nr:hypothetical protein [Sulfuriflexus sp.]